jgi:Holliday junction DNA helicase RuvB
VNTGDLDRSYRPLSFGEFVGQEPVVQNLTVAVQAALMRKEPLEHVLFCGPPGLGKTTLAEILAHELGAPFEKVSGPTLERPRDLASILTRLKPLTVLFIDEIHRIGTAVEELLYLAMEDFRISIVIGEGPGARNVEIKLNPFTLVGATTRTSLLSRPLLDRFGLIEQLDYYKERELVVILQRYADKLGVAVEPSALELVSRRSQGTPRIALAHLRRIRDFAQVEGEKERVTTDVVERALKAIGVDEQGLQRLHRRYLELLVLKYGGGPTGVNTLAAALGEDPQTIENFVEPYLIRMGFIERTPRGRTATRSAKGLFRGGATHPSLFPLPEEPAKR